MIRDGKPSFFPELIPMANAISNLRPSNLKSEPPEDRRAAAQLKRERKAARRLKEQSHG